MSGASVLDVRLQALVDRLNTKFATLTGLITSVSNTVLGIVSPTTPQKFGAVGDGVTDDSAAFVAALADLKARALGAGFYKASPKLFVPAGKYFLGTTTLDITHTLIIEGEASGFDGAAYTSQLIWAANTTGIRIQRYDTSGATAVDNVNTHTGGDGTVIRSIALKGAFTATEGEYHGVHAKARCKLDGVRIENFQGDGLYANASAGVGAPGEGNANTACVMNCSFSANRNGMYVQGADVNIWTIVGLDAGNNRRYGVCDISFLGNSYFGVHSHDNGLTGYSGPYDSFVTYLAKRYCARKGGTWSNAPSGTTADTADWYYVDAGGAPAWSAVGVYRDGGGYRSDGGGNANNLFSGCYFEGGQGYAQIDAPALVSGGSMRPAVRGVGVVYGSSSRGGGIGVAGALAVSDNIQTTGPQMDFGPVTGASDLVFNLNSTNTEVGFWAYISGVLKGYIRNVAGTWYLDAPSGSHLRVGGADTLTVGAGGADLATGKVLSVNGTQVVTSRQTGTPAAATDAATTQALVNDIRTKLIAHGLIS